MALEQRALTVQVADEHFVLESGLGSHRPDRVFAMPLIYDGALIAILELGLHGELTTERMDFLNAASESIAIAINTAQARLKVQELLDTTTQQTTTLQKQQEDLRSANAQTCLLYTSPSPRDRQKSRMPSSA